MDKKYIVISLIVAGILLILGFFVIKMQNKKDTNPGIIAVPLNSFLVMKFDDIFKSHENLRKNNILKSLKDIPEFESIRNFASLSDSIESMEKFKKLKAHGNCIISMQMVNETDFGSLLIFSNIQNPSSTEKLISKLFGTPYSIDQYKYEKAIINNIQKDGKAFLYFTVYNDFLLVSKYSLIIEDAVRQINSKVSLLNNNDFKSVYETAGKTDINVFINQKMLAPFMKIFANRQFNRQIDNFENYSSWSEFDIEVKDELLFFGGFSLPENKSYLNIYTDLKPQKHTIFKVLPASTSLISSISFNSFQKYIYNYKRFLGANGLSSKYEKYVYDCKTTLSADLETYLMDNCDNEVANVFCNINPDNLEESNYFVIKVKSQSQAHNDLRSMISQYCKTNSLNERRFISYFAFDKETTYPIYKLPFSEMNSHFFGNFSTITPATYCTFYDNYLILGTSVNSLSYFLKMNVLNRTLEYDAEFSGISKNISEKSNYFFYFNIKKNLGLIRSFGNEKLIKIFEDNQTKINQIQAVNFELSGNKKMIYNSATVCYSQKVETNYGSAIWETTLDTAMLMSPKIVINHASPEKEIFVQDGHNKVYLINKAGRIIWSRNIDEKIISDVFQIDYMKNGKLQYLFNTETRIYILDRNGNFVERYPIRLPSKATNGLNVFDYDKTKEYRIAVATEDKKILLYSKEGNRLAQWKFLKSEGIIHDKIEHFRIRDKDFIVAFDDKMVYILNRFGDTKVAIPTIINKALKSKINIVPSPNIVDSKIVITDVFGTIHFIGLNGKVTQKKFELYSRNHQFIYDDINIDGKKEYIFADDETLQVIDEKGNYLFEKNFDSNIKSIEVFSIFGEKKIGVATEKGKIFLLDAEGKNFGGTPFKGYTMFSIGKLTPENENYNIVVGGENNILYNYELKNTK